MWIAVGKGKGGTGGTTTALELVHAAARRRQAEQPPRAVAYVDLDPQGDGTAGLEPDRLAPGIKDVLRQAAEHVPLRDVLISSARPGILVAPAGRQLANREMDMPPDSVAALRHERIRGGVSDLVADVVIDIPKGLGRLAAAGLLGAEYLVIVARPSLWSAQGAEEIRHSAEIISRNRNPELKIAELVITEHDYSRDAERVLGEMRGSRNLGNLIHGDPIPRNPLVREALESFHMSLRETGDPGLTEISDTYQEIYDRLRREHGE